MSAYIPNSYVLYLQQKGVGTHTTHTTHNTCPTLDNDDNQEHILFVNPIELNAKMQRMALELKLIIFDATICFKQEQERSTLYMTKFEKFDHDIKLLEIQTDLLKLEKELCQIDTCL